MMYTVERWIEEDDVWGPEESECEGDGRLD